LAIHDDIPKPVSPSLPIDDHDLLPALLTTHTSVWASFTAERIHRWPKADQLDDHLVQHLTYAHQHLFQVRVTVAVTDTDREVSFERLRSEARFMFDETIPSNSTMSCERMASVLATNLLQTYPALLEVVVSEDGLNGATWHRRLTT